MRAAVIYESMFGNTQLVASSIAEGLRSSMQVDLFEVAEADPDVVSNADVLVVGGPTHAYGMSRAGTRQTAAKDAGDRLVSRGVGLREWLATLPSRPGARCASFDTRFRKPSWMVGSAAKGIDSRLREKGYRAVAKTESFFVSKTPGPLYHGELERAEAWGSTLADRVARTPVS